MSHSPSCLFCKIVRGELPAARVFETEQAVAFLDINPVNPGHVLLVPKDHHASLADLPDEISGAAAAHLPRLCRAVREATGAEGLNVIVNLGRVAGQTIDHVHWHVIPRFNGDAVRWPWPHIPYQDDELDRMKSRIEQALAGA